MAPGASVTALRGKGTQGGPAHHLPLGAEPTAMASCGDAPVCYHPEPHEDIRSGPPRVGKSVAPLGLFPEGNNPICPTF